MQVSDFDLADEWHAGITNNNGGTHGIVLSRWPRTMRLDAVWSRDATGKEIAIELRKLAAALEKADQ